MALPSYKYRLRANLVIATNTEGNRRHENLLTTFVLHQLPQLQKFDQVPFEMLADRANPVIPCFLLPADANTMEKQCKESDRSSNISDLKLDLRTGSSNSNVHCDMDYIPGAESETGSESVITRIGVPLAGPVNVSGQEVYRYSADYTEPNFPPKVSNAICGVFIAGVLDNLSSINY